MDTVHLGLATFGSNNSCFRGTPNQGHIVSRIKCSMSFPIHECKSRIHLTKLRIQRILMTWNRMVRHSRQHKRTNCTHHEMGCRRANNMEKCYHDCRQWSDTTRRHEVTRGWTLKLYTSRAPEKTL